MDYYSFNRPRRDGWLSWPYQLTDSERFTHKVVTRPAISLTQDSESSPARTGGLTTMLRYATNFLSCPVQLHLCRLLSNFLCYMNTTDDHIDDQWL